MKKILFLLLVPVLAFAQPQGFPCKIKTIYDGDSGVALIQVDSATVIEQTFRLVGIDAPEKQNPFNGFKAQPFGLDAAKIVRDSFLGRIGYYYPLHEDQYGRMVARIVVGTTDISHFETQNGLAWAYPSSLLPDTENIMFQLEKKAAMKAKIGLWALPGRKLSPWVWRARNRI